MGQVVFHLMSEQNSNNILEYACQLASDAYRNRQTVFLYCADTRTCETLDEQLWQFDPARFVPHQLQGETSRKRAPVEIGSRASSQRYQVLINLTDAMPDFATQYRQIIDFVPADATGKEKARERYKHYRAAGFELSTQPARVAPTETE